MGEQSVQQVDGTTLAAAGELDTAQAAEIGGGADNCSVTVTVGTDGMEVKYSANTVGEALIAAYEGMVDATSHVIGRVLGP